MNQFTLYQKGALLQPSGKDDILPIDFIVDLMLKSYESYNATTVVMNNMFVKKDNTLNWYNKMFIVNAKTASGKSTIMPTRLWGAFEKFNKKILVSQPKILTTMEISRDIAFFYKEFTLGVNIGYTTGKAKINNSKGVTLINIDMMYAIFASQENLAEYLERVSILIIDEAHEMNKGLVGLMSLLKELYSGCDSKTLAKLPLIIITSATLNIEMYQKYLSIPDDNIVKVSGKKLTITETYLDKDFPPVKQDPNSKFQPLPYLPKTIETMLKVHEENLDDDDTNKHMIIFCTVPANRPIEEAINKYNKKPENANKKILFIKLNSATYNDGKLDYRLLNMPIAEYNKHQKNSKYIRKIICSTNVAETGVSIKALKYCIDTGYTYNSIFIPSKGYYEKEDKFIDRGSYTQRMGRVGRSLPGVYYAIYTKEKVDKMREYNPSDLSIIDLSSFVFNLLYIHFKPKEMEYKSETDDVKSNAKVKKFDEMSKAKETKDGDEVNDEVNDEVDEVENKPYKIHNKTYIVENVQKPFKVDLLDQPDYYSLNYSMRNLFSLGAINDKLNVTKIGIYVKNLMQSMNLETCRMIISAYANGCNIYDMVALGSIIDVGADRVFKREKTFESNNSLIETLNLYKEYVNYINKDIDSWISKHKVNTIGMVEVVERVNKVIKNMLACDMNPYLNINKKDSEEAIMRCFNTGYGKLLITYDPSTRSYMWKGEKISCECHRNKSVKYIVPSSIICTGGTFVHDKLYYEPVQFDDLFYNF